MSDGMQRHVVIMGVGALRRLYGRCQVLQTAGYLTSLVRHAEAGAGHRCGRLCTRVGYTASYVVSLSTAHAMEPVMGLWALVHGVVAQAMVCARDEDVVR